MNVFEWVDQYLDILDEDIARDRPSWLHLADDWEWVKRVWKSR